MDEIQQAHALFMNYCVLFFLKRTDIVWLCTYSLASHANLTVFVYERLRTKKY